MIACQNCLTQYLTTRKNHEIEMADEKIALLLNKYNQIQGLSPYDISGGIMEWDEQDTIEKLSI